MKLSSESKNHVFIFAKYIQPCTYYVKTFVFRIAAEEQEKRDYELAMRLAQVSVMLSSTNVLEFIFFCVERMNNIHNK